MSPAIRPMPLLAAILLAAAAPIAAAASAPATYPDRPLRLIVPFPPGGGADTLARMIMARVAPALGQPIVVENRPGAGGNLGAESVARAEPDGYTLLYGTNGTHAINPHLYRDLRFDPLKDLAPVSRLTEIAAVLVVHPKLPVQSVPELIQYARAHPGKVNFASAGNGTTSHLAGEMFRSAAGIDIVHIPYRGGAAAIADLVSGQVQMMIEVMPNALPLARDQRVRALAVTTAQRSASAPELPTVAETGMRGFEASAWDGIFVPAATAPAIVARLNAAIRTALEEPELVAALRARGATPIPGTPEAFARHIAASSEQWGRAVRSSGAKVD